MERHPGFLKDGQEIILLDKQDCKKTFNQTLNQNNI